MKNNGGFILIKIDKKISGVTADDFDLKLFKEIYNKNIKKPLILELNDSEISFPLMEINSTGLYYYFTNIIMDGGNIDGVTQIMLRYNKTNDLVEWEYVSY